MFRWFQSVRRSPPERHADQILCQLNQQHHQNSLSPTFAAYRTRGSPTRRGRASGGRRSTAAAGRLSTRRWPGFDHSLLPATRKRTVWATHPVFWRFARGHRWLWYAAAKQSERVFAWLRIDRWVSLWRYVARSISSALPAPWSWQRVSEQLPTVVEYILSDR